MFLLLTLPGLTLLLAVSPALAVQQLPDFEVRETPPEKIESTGAHTTINSQTLHRPGATLSRIISRTAGAQVLESGGIGSYSSAMLRGADSEQVMVFLDGFLLNTSSGGGVDLSTIDLLQAEYVDIYRGTTPGAFTQSSLGGAINIKTLSDDGPSTTALTAGLSSFNTQLLGVAANKSLSLGYLTVSASMMGSDNDYPFVNDNGTEFNTSDDFSDHRKNAGFSQKSAMVKLQQKKRSAASGRLLLQYLDKNQQLPDRNNSTANSTRLDTENLNAQAAITNKLRSLGQAKLDSGLFFRRETEDFRDLRGKLSLTPQQSRSRTMVSGLSNHADWTTNNSSLAVHTEARIESFKNKNLLNNTIDTEAERQQLDISVQYSANPAKGKLTVVPVLRFHWQDNSYRIERGFNTDVQTLAPSRLSALTPQLGFSYELNPETSLYANTGLYYRPPSFVELFGDRGFLIGDSSLMPEKGVSSDMGFESRFKINPEAELRSNWSIFHRKITDAISRTYGANGIGKSINIPGALIYGIEANADIEFYAQLAIGMNLTWQNARNDDSRPAFYHKQLPGRAQKTFNLFIEKSWGEKLAMHYAWSLKQNRYYDTANLIVAPDEGTHEIGLSFNLARWHLGLEIHNLTDTIYEDFNGYPKPGRSIHFKITYNRDMTT